ncbi:MAG: hypothetical protein R6W91_05875 [Thermoplasmata archaeon]
MCQPLQRRKEDFARTGVGVIVTNPFLPASGGEKTSSQVADICAPGVRKSGVVYLNEPSRIKLGGLWPEDIARLQREEGNEVVDYGIEDDGYHYWAICRGR